MQRQQLQWNDGQYALQTINLLWNLYSLIRVHRCLSVTHVADHDRISLNTTINITHTYLPDLLRLLYSALTTSKNHPKAFGDKCLTQVNVKTAVKGHVFLWTIFLQLLPVLLPVPVRPDPPEICRSAINITALKTYAFPLFI